MRGLRLGCVAALVVLLSPVVSFLLQAQDTVKELEARALALEKQGNAQGALTAWEKAAALAPNSARVEDQIGFLLAVLKRNNDALPHFERALELDSHFGPAHFHLGVAYLLEQDPNRGIPHLESAVDTAPDNFDYQIGRASCRERV